MDTIVFSDIDSIKEKGYIKIQARVKGAKFAWFTIPEKFEWMIDKKSADGFLLIYIWIAMELGKNLDFQYPVSEKVEKNIEKIMQIFSKLCPTLNDKITVTAPLLAEQTSPIKKYRATGFSGGVDSLHTCLNYEKKHIPFDVFLFSSTGQHGRENTEEIFNKRFEKAISCLPFKQKEVIKIDSNLDNIFSENFIQTHTLRNSSCALLLQNGISNYIYSATFTDPNGPIFADKDMATVDTKILPLFSSEKLTFESGGSEIARSEKLSNIVTDRNFTGNLYVCTEKNLPIANCGYCFKCRRTMVALNALGYQEVIKNNFPILSKMSILNIALLVNAEKEKTDEDTAQLLYKQMRVSKFFMKTLALCLSKIKRYMPLAFQWRIKQRWPHIW